MKAAICVGLGLGLLGTAMAAPTPAKPAAKPAAKPPAPMAFKPVELDLAPGETYPVELFVPSPTGKTFTGTPRFAVERAITINADPRWKGKVPPWGAKTFPKLTASRDAEGEYAVKSTIGDGEKAPSAELMVRVAAPQVEFVTGLFKLTVKVTNPFKHRAMTGRIVISNPDRFLEDVTTREFKIPAGETQDLLIPLPGAAPVEGEAYDFTLTVQTYQGYKVKKTYPLEFPSHT
ncbi:MAG: hypothetical protein ACO1SX_03250 [Actinomycetota bacterium]